MNLALNPQGALQGAAGGAAVGTGILPGWGTAIGGAVGGLGGLLSRPPAPADPLFELTGFTTPQVLTLGVLAGVVFLVTR